MTTDRERLEALRERLEGVISDPATSPRDLATVAREYRILVHKLSELRPAERSALDEIAARRAQRRSS